MPRSAPSLPHEARAVPVIVPAMLIAASGMSILSTDLYTPSLPHLPAYFGSDARTVQLTMSLNLAGYALAQLVHGPLADRFGRRPVLLFGMAAFCLASLGCALAGSVGMLIGFRVAQGVAASTQGVVVAVLIRELYPGDRAVRVMAAYGMSVALAPALGPMIGGYVHVWLGWRANFALLAALIVVVTTVQWRVVPETVGADRPTLAARQQIARYLALVGNRRYRSYVLISTANMAGLFGFITGAPFVFIDALGVPTQHFGFYQMASVGAFFLGSLAANRLVGRIAIESMLRIGLSVLLGGGLLTVAVVLAGAAGPIALTLCMAVYVSGMALTFATAPMRAFDSTTVGYGQASALSGSLQMGGAAVGAWVVGLLYDGTAWPLAVALLGAGLCGHLAYYLGRPWRLPAA